MNKKQEAAANRVAKALNRCGQLGLTGGIYEGTLYFWPKKHEPRDMPGDFFNNIRKVGGDQFDSHDIVLDGGGGG